MKKLLKVIPFLFFYCLIFSQEGEIKSINAYYDAIFLKEFTELNNKNEYVFKILGEHGGFDSVEISKYLPLLKSYFPELKDSDISAVIVAVNDKSGESYNPFLADLLEGTGTLSATDVGKNSGIAEKSILGPAGRLNVDNLVKGLAQFLVDRAKKELSITFFQKFRQDLTNFEELKILFPETHKGLLSIGDQIYDYSKYLTMLRDAFKDDVKVLIPNLRLLIDSGLIAKYKTVNPVVERIFDNALLIADELQKGKHPAELIKLLIENNTGNRAQIKNLGPTLQVMDLISQSLRFKNEDRHWISNNELNALIGDDVTLNIYLGLLYAQTSNITFETKSSKESVPFRKLLGDFKEGFDENKIPIRDFLKSTIASAQKIDKNFKSIKDKSENNEESTYAERYEFYTASIDLLQNSLTFFKIPVVKENLKFNTEKLEKYFRVAELTGDLYLDIREEEYFGALTNLHGILEETVFISKDKEKKQIRTFIQRIEALQRLNQMSKEDIQTFLREQIQFEDLRPFEQLNQLPNTFTSDMLSQDEIAEVNKVLKDLISTVEEDLSVLWQRYRTVLPKLTKYGNLIIGVALAKNSDEVYSIIDAIVSPVGSASQKKHSKSTIELNAYVGLSGGTEFNGSSKVYDFFGVSAPIGVTISGSHQGILTGDPTKDNDAASSLFVTLIDLGAVTSFRFGNDEEVELPEIKLENIFAPGLYYVYGFPRVPLSFGVGGQLGPQLRGINEEGIDLSTELSFSLRAFLAVDIPLLNFSTKSR